MGEAQRPIIEIENLVKTYDFLPVLRQLNLSVERGEFVALLGPNGSGKSTLLRLLAARSRPTAGQIRIGGWSLPDEAQHVRAQIGLVSHKSLMYENLTAAENLRFFSTLHNLNGEGREQRIAELLQQVGLSRRADHLLRTFSRGMQQRLTIARALLHQPHLLLLDEPYTGLDQSAAETLDALLREAAANGHTILMATHQFDRAVLLASRIVILSRGRVGYDAAAHRTGDAVALASVYAETTGMAAAR